MYIWEATYTPLKFFAYTAKGPAWNIFDYLTDQVMSLLLTSQGRSDPDPEIVKGRQVGSNLNNIILFLITFLHWKMPKTNQTKLQVKYDTHNMHFLLMYLCHN